MKRLSLLLILFIVTSLPGWSESLKMTELVTPEKVEAGQFYDAVIRLNKPAPKDGLKVMFLPAHHLKLPDAVWVEEGKTEATFEFKVYRKKLDRTLFKSHIVISTLVNGKLKEWEGPKLAHQH